MRDMQLVDLYPTLGGLLARVEAGIGGVWEGGEDFLGTAARRALSGRGKRLRPGVLLLAAECAGGATETSVALAGVVELVHAASLVHDDVVDGAGSRRGHRSANAMWGNKVSVLLGDYLIARGLELLPKGSRERFIPWLAGVAAAMCRGQVEELRAAGRPLTEPEYVEIARAKTGSLFAFCGGAGAETGGGEAEVVRALAGFGESFGVAFQFADDVLDLVGTAGQSGKPEGRDLAERKFTLPLVLAVEMGGPEVARRLGDVMARDGVGNGDVAEARAVAESVGAVEAAWGRVRDWLERGRAELETAPEGEGKRALMALCGEAFPMPVMAGEI